MRYTGRSIYDNYECTDGRVWPIVRRCTSADRSRFPGDCWEALMGDSWESVDGEDLEAEYQRMVRAGTHQQAVEP